MDDYSGILETASETAEVRKTLSRPEGAGVVGNSPCTGDLVGEQAWLQESVNGRRNSGRNDV